VRNCRRSAGWNAGTQQTMKRYVVSLKSRGALHETQTGGKGAALAWLHRRAFRVPDGYILTASAFQAFLETTGLQPLARPRRWEAPDSNTSASFWSPVPYRRPGPPIIRAYHRLAARWRSAPPWWRGHARGLLRWATGYDSQRPR